MNSGRPMTRSILLVFAAMLAMPAVALAGDRQLDADALIGRLARPAPASTAFTGIRFSPLLREPLIVSGRLGYSGPASLDRLVTEPYRENTTIRGESVRVEREGEPPRSFGLKRAPELRGLLRGFTALLSGDVKALRRSFDVEVSGDEDSWTVELTPLDTRARRRLQRITVNGRGDMPRCFSMLGTGGHAAGGAQENGGASIMLLGEAAGAELPENPTLDAVLKLCRAE